MALSRLNDPVRWSGHIVWGNHRLGGGVLHPRPQPHGAPTCCGAAATTPDGVSVTWGHGLRRLRLRRQRARRQPAREHVWDTSRRANRRTSDAENIVGARRARNATARTSSGARACRSTASDRVVWGTSSDARIVGNERPRLRVAGCARDELTMHRVPCGAHREDLPLPRGSTSASSPSARAAGKFFPCVLGNTAVPAAARAVVGHVGLQGEPAARAAVVDDVGVVRGRFRRRCCCSAPTRR